MNQDENDFLKELQESCLKEVEDYLNEFREVLSAFKNDPLKSIELLQKIIHSMKGNLQAVAFLQFGNYVHQLETILDKKSRMMIVPEGKKIPDFEVLVCEFLISSVLEAMETYHMDLKKVGIDSDEFSNSRAQQLLSLDQWEPKFETSDTPMFTPSENIVHEQPNIDLLVSNTNGDQVVQMEKIVLEPKVEELQIPEIPKIQGTLENPEIQVQSILVDENASVEVVPSIDKEPMSPLNVAPPSSEENVQASNESIKSEENESQQPPEAWSDYRGSGLFLLFQNHKKYFAIAIEHIVEVIKSQPMSSPPHKRKNLSGLLNLRGEVLPILNVEEILTENGQKPTYVVVSQVNDLRFGFQVEAVHQVVTLNPKTFQVVNGFANDSKSGIVTHFCQTDDKTISILKLNELVAA